MNSILSLTISTLFAGAVLLLAVGLNTSLSELSSQQTINVSVQENAASTASIVEADFRRIGYGAGSTPITAADTCGNITFKAVVDSSGGSVKTIQYLVSTGPDGHQRLTRKVNGAATVIYDHVDSFRVTYYDKSGNRMPGAALVLGNIGSLNVRMYLRSAMNLVPSDTAGYRAAGVYWEKRITPKSLQSTL